jgi:hypothetical protein
MMELDKPIASHVTVARWMLRWHVFTNRLFIGAYIGLVVLSFFAARSPIWISIIGVVGFLLLLTLAESILVGHALTSVRSQIAFDAFTNTNAFRLFAVSSLLFAPPAMIVAGDAQDFFKIWGICSGVAFWKLMVPMLGLRVTGTHRETKLGFTDEEKEQILAIAVPIVAKEWGVRVKEKAP